MTEIKLYSEAPKARGVLVGLGFNRKNLIPYPDYLSVVIALGMGSNKKKPMTKKERDEKRKKHKEKRLKK
jgi:hypothetical protein